MFFKVCIAFALLLIVISCGTSLYIPGPEHASNDASLEELTTGRALYIEHCSSCHMLYKPSSYTRAQWKNEVDEMQERSKIDDGQKELILKYLWNAPELLTSGLSNE